MPDPDRLRLVLDTNTVLRGLARPRSASSFILSACEDRRATLLLSRSVLTEYRHVLSDPEIAERHPAIAAKSIEVVLRALRYRSEFLAATDVRFRFDRDPSDAKFVELAIAGRATHIVSNDKDLLSLNAAHTDAAKRFRQRLPQVEVLDSASFMQRFAQHFRP